VSPTKTEKTVSVLTSPARIDEVSTQSFSTVATWSVDKVCEWLSLHSFDDLLPLFKGKIYVDL
jgi:hypothetical protein